MSALPITSDHEQLTRIGSLVVDAIAIIIIYTRVVIIVFTGACFIEYFVVLLAEQAVLAKREFVTRDQLSFTRRTPKALNMVNFRLGSHHKIVFAKT